QDGFGVIRESRLVKPHQIAHQPHVHEIHRMCETIAQCEYSPVLFLLEVGEDVGSSTRKEYFSWFTRVFAIQGLVQQRREIDILIHTHHSHSSFRRRSSDGACLWQNLFCRHPRSGISRSALRACSHLRLETADLLCDLHTSTPL